MKPAPFDYVRPETLDEVLEALAQAGGDACILAGGQSLVPMLNFRLARPSVLIDVMGLAALKVLEEREGRIVIGAGIRQGELERWSDLARALPLVAAALPWVGHVQTRGRGTVCGSIAHADPSAELPLVLMALEGEVWLRSTRGSRRAPAGSFFTGAMTTDLAEDEMIEALSLPVAAPGSGFAFNEISRRHGDFAIVACAAVVNGDGARLAVGGVADAPVALRLPGPAEPDLEDALNELAWSLGARDDLHASARYRRELVRHLGRKTIEEAAAWRN